MEKATKDTQQRAGMPSALRRLVGRLRVCGEIAGLRNPEACGGGFSLGDLQFTQVPASYQASCFRGAVFGPVEGSQPSTIGSAGTMPRNPSRSDDRMVSQERQPHARHEFSFTVTQQTANCENTTFLHPVPHLEAAKM